ncbi:MAG: aminoacyl-tRNA hydrolase [Planctomycetota bacterium]|jgi:PTH1 family peptidyl-tRNA hydrolase
MPDEPTRPVARLVLGLGNPGAQYDGTRHNVGFEVVERLAARVGAGGFLQRGRSLVARGEVGGVPCLLAKPQTYMNRSGQAARELLSDLDGPADLLVVCDDFHLPLGRLRCRRTGSDGGQLGLASVIGALAPDEVPRLRLGIGDPGRVPAEDYVLQPFGHGERREVEDMVDRAAACLEAWLAHGDLPQLIAAANAGPQG